MWNNFPCSDHTPDTRRLRRCEPHSDLDASEYRCRSGAGVPNRKSRREDGLAPSRKIDPPQRSGQWPVTRKDPRPVRHQMSLQRVHAKTNVRNQSLQQSQVPKSTCKAEKGGVDIARKSLRHRQKFFYPCKGRKILDAPESMVTPS